MEEGGKSWPRPPKMKGEEGGSKEEEMTKFVHNIFPTLRGAVGQHSGGRGGATTDLRPPLVRPLSPFCCPPFLHQEKVSPYATLLALRVFAATGPHQGKRAMTHLPPPPSPLKGGKDWKAESFTSIVRRRTRLTIFLRPLRTGIENAESRSR